MRPPQEAAAPSRSSGGAADPALDSLPACEDVQRHSRRLPSPN
jgi:hypothetical protein